MRVEERQPLDATKVPKLRRRASRLKRVDAITFHNQLEALLARAAKLGLVSMQVDNGRYDPTVMAAALRALPRQKRPSEVVVPGLLEGLSNVARLVAPWVETARGEVPQIRSRSA